MVKKIALEEHFLAPGHEAYWRTTVGNVEPSHAANLLARLSDFGEMRLKSMDEAGIARSVLSVAGPSAQIERDAAKATRVAREANDFLAKEIQKRPDRYSGFAHLAVQDARGAADEIERANGATAGATEPERAICPRLSMYCRQSRKPRMS